MPDSSYYRDQAERYDRVADLCSVPELVGYYRQLAEDCRRSEVAGRAVQRYRRVWTGG